MKKILLLTAFAVVGFTVVSCSSDDNEAENTPTKVVEIENNGESLFLKEGDTLGEGPGDDPIIVPPPPTKP